MSHFKNRNRKSFTQVSNLAVRDKELSLKAKGLLLVMLSFPDDWQYHMQHIEGISADGRDAHMNAVKELEQRGYVLRRKVKDEQGRFGGTEYLVSDETMNQSGYGASADIVTSSTNGFSSHGKTVAGKTVAGKTVAGKPATTNTDLTKTEFTKTETAAARQPTDLQEGGQAAAVSSEEDSQIQESEQQPHAPELPDPSQVRPVHQQASGTTATTTENVPRRLTERSEGGAQQVTPMQALGKCFKRESFLTTLLEEFPDRQGWLSLEAATIFELLGKARTQFGPEYATPLILALDQEAAARRKKQQEAVKEESQELTFEQKLEAALRGEMI